MSDTIERPNFFAALVAPARSPEIPESADAYGWLVGSWALAVRHYGVDVSARALTAEAHFSWILGGLGIQDVWLMPSATGDAPAMYGTTLRLWDRSLQAWRISWTDPFSGRRDQLIGRRVGQDIVQVGTQLDGTPIRWSFTDVGPDTFRWTGESLQPDGKTWRLEGDFRARRRR